MFLDRDRTAVLVVDMQEPFRQSIGRFDALLSSIATLSEGGAELGVPTLATEHYPRGLGPVAPEIGELLGDAGALQKSVLSAAAAPGFDLGGRDQVLLTGIETHVCIYQTAATLVSQEIEVQVVVDAVASRAVESHRVAIDRLRGMGVPVTSVEMALFELLRESGTPEFKAIQSMFKSR